MSTKTTFKRIALVAVVSLGFGMLSAVPSFAATTAVATSVPVATAASTTLSLGDTATATVGFTTAAATVAADDQTYTGTTVRIVVPSGSSVTLADRNGSASGTTAAFDLTGATADLVAAVNATTGAVTGDATGIVAAGAVTAGTITLLPDVAGTYSIIVTSTAGTTATATINVANLYGEVADGISNGTQANRAINGVAGVANSVTLTFRTTASASRLITVTGSTIVSATTPAGTGGASTIAADKLSMIVTDDATAEDITVVIATPAVGTITVNAFAPSSQAGIYSTTAYGTVTITVNAAATNGAVLSTSTATMTAVGTGSYLSADALSLTGTRSTRTDAVASIAVSLAVGTGQSLLSTNATTISITGPGLLVVSGGTTNATGRSITETGSDGTFDVAVKGDGTSGVATVTITSGAFTATRTVTFYGSVASYALTTKNAYLAVGVTDTQILTVLAKDSAGINIPSATAFVSSSSTSTATVTSSSVVTSDDGATGADIGARGVAAGTATITVGNASSAPTVSATFTLNIVKAGIASVALSFDKAEYTAGEKAVITVTAKNADAALVGDATYATLFTAAGITSSANLTGLVADPSVATTSGVKTYTVFMPLAAGPVSISATLGASVAVAIQDTVVTTSATVVSDGVAQAAADAAAEATDAANAATDAANAAAEAADAATAAAQDAADAVAALSTQVSEMVNALKKQITALTNLVIKIQKKVKA